MKIFIMLKNFVNLSCRSNPADILDAFFASTTTENRQIFQEDVKAVKDASCMYVVVSSSRMDTNHTYA